MKNMRRMLPLWSTVFMLQAVLISSSLFAIAEQSLALPVHLPANAEFQTQLRALVAQATWIGRGRVVDSRSFWNETHSAIESEYTVAISYALMGETLPALVVRTSGGYLPAEKLGMVDTHTATLAKNEEVLLFLRKVGATYQLVDHDSKFTVLANHAVSALWQKDWPLAELYSLLETELAQQKRRSVLPSGWASLEPAVLAAGQLVPENFVYLNLKWDTSTVNFKININTAQVGGDNGSLQDFQQAIVAGATTWSMVAGADFSLFNEGTTDVSEPVLNSKNEIMFMKRGATDIAGQGRLWYTENRIIKEADMWLNDDRIWDATGKPANTEIDLQSVALHEFGHWLGLGHDLDATAIMYSTLSLGTLKRELTSNEIAGVTYIYPCASSPCQPSYTPTATPTVLATPTSTATPTPTLSPTPTFSSTSPPGQVGTPTPTTTANPTASPGLTPSPRSTPSSEGNVYLPLVRK